MIGAEMEAMSGFKEYEDFDALAIAGLVRRNDVTPDELPEAASTSIRHQRILRNTDDTDAELGATTQE